MHDIVRSDPEGNLTIEQFAAHVSKSGFYRHLTDPSKAIVQIAMGHALGLPAITAVSNIHVIEGKPSMGVHIISGLIKKSGKYDYRVKSHSSTESVVDFREWNGSGWEVIGTSSFTIQDAQRAGLTGKQNWKSYPQAMLFARAMSQGARMYCPDLFLGGVYVPEEIPSRSSNNIHPDPDPDDPSTIIDVPGRSVRAEEPARMPENSPVVESRPERPTAPQKPTAPRPAPAVGENGGKCSSCWAPAGKKHTMKCSTGMGGQVFGSETVIPVQSVVVEETDPFEEEEATSDKPYEVGGDLLSGYDVPGAFQ